MFIEVILYILLLLAIGHIAKRIGILNMDRVNVLNKLAFYLALPSLIFRSLYQKPLQQIFSFRLAIGFCSVIFLTVGIGWVVFRTVENNASKSISIAQSYHGNIGYMGLPVIAMALENATGQASLLLGLGSIMQIPLTILVLIYLNSTSKNVINEMRRVIINPVIVALVLGILFSLFSIQIPRAADTVLFWIGEAALPIAMLGVGATLKLENQRQVLPILGSVAGLKVVLMPLLGFILFTILGVIDSTGAKAGIIMLGMPTAISTFIYSTEFGGDEELASSNISFTTLISLATISVLLFFFT